MKIIYCLAWSPLYGEATYTTCFDTERERDRFKALLGKARSVSTWENETKGAKT